MQKTIKTMLALVAGAMALSACSNEDIFNSKKQPTGNMTFTATVSDEEGEATRASLDGLKIVWNKGDAISVFSGADLTTNNKMTLTSGAGTTSASFTGNCAKSQQYYAIYPYNAEHSAKDANDNSMGCKIVWNCAEQTAVNGSFDPSVPMIAKASNISETATSVPLQFKNIYSFVKVTTDYKCKSITLTSKSNNIATAFKYIAFDNEGNLNPTFESTTQSNVITLKGKDGANIEAGTYYIAVAPTTVSKGFDLTFTSACDGTKKYTKSTSKSVTFTRNKVLNLGSVTLRGTDVETLEGAGTSENPYKINDMDDLITFQRWITAEYNMTWNKVYLQTADIDAQGREMAPIGTAEHRFWGTYDGGNHYIKNLRYKGTIEYNDHASTNFTFKVSALFGAIRGATIKNLTIWDPLFDGSNKGTRLSVSPLVGVAFCGEGSYDSSRCKILNCHITGQHTIITSYDGASFSKGAGFNYGGFVAESMSNLEISDCSTSMKLYMKYDGKEMIEYGYAGGFVGTADPLKIKNAKNTFSTYDANAEIRINRCRNNNTEMTFNTVLSSVYIGGFIGYALDSSMDDVACKVYNSVNNAPIQVIGSYYSFDHNFQTQAIIGGFIGNNDSDGFSSVDPCFKNCVNNGYLTAQDCAVSMGGIAGVNYDDDTQFTNCANTGELKTGNSKYYPGAISYKNGTFNDCYNCVGGYYICREDAGEGTNIGESKTMDWILDHMNNTSLVKNNASFCSWKKSTFGSWNADILDLDF